MGVTYASHHPSQLPIKCQAKKKGHGTYRTRTYGTTDAGSGISQPFDRTSSSIVATCGSYLISSARSTCPAYVRPKTAHVGHVANYFEPPAGLRTMVLNLYNLNVSIVNKHSCYPRLGMFLSWMQLPSPRRWNRNPGKLVLTYVS